MKKAFNILLFAALATAPALAQQQAPVIISGEAFTRPLVEKWISDYQSQNPDVKISFEPKASTSSLQLQLETPAEANASQAYFNIARVAILPVANVASPFAAQFGQRGLDKKEVSGLYFEDLLAEEKSKDFSDVPHQILTRLGAQGLPAAFSATWGFSPENFKGNAIAGNDQHLLKATLEDPQAVSFNALNLLYDAQSRKPLAGLAILPLDLNGNGRVSEEERIWGDLDQVLQRLESSSEKDLANIPTARLQLVLKNANTASEDAQDFLRWVLENGQSSLNTLGFLKLNEKDQVREREKLALKP